MREMIMELLVMCSRLHLVNSMEVLIKIKLMFTEMTWQVEVLIVIAKLPILKVIIPAECILEAALVFLRMLTVFQANTKDNRMLRTASIAYQNKAVKLTLAHLVPSNHQLNLVSPKSHLQINII